MLIIFFRATILYIFVLIVMRLMGKREIGQLQPFELAISIMIADLASVPMTELGIPLSNGIIPILGMLFMHMIISFINIKSVNMRKIICLIYIAIILNSMVTSCFSKFAFEYEIDAAEIVNNNV